MKEVDLNMRLFDASIKRMYYDADEVKLNDKHRQDSNLHENQMADFNSLDIASVWPGACVLSVFHNFPPLCLSKCQS
jgi:hypothetical protein